VFIGPAALPALSNTVAFAFSFKVAPRFGVGEDAVRPYGLIGG
jgi:hypothetical protein